jgi:hypothetical protein
MRQCFLQNDYQVIYQLYSIHKDLKSIGLVNNLSNGESFTE